MNLDNDDELGYPLSPETFIKRIDAEMESLTHSIIHTGVSNFETYKELRGRFLSCDKMKKLFLNKR